MSRPHRWRRAGGCLLVILVGGSIGGSLAAAPLTIVKSFATVSDPQGNLLPKAIPGAEVDYSITITNPGANSFSNVNGVVFEDAIPARTMMRVSDLGPAGSGPIEFLDGSLLGLGLLGSNLSYTYRGLSDTTDGLEFSADKGVTWGFRPSDQGGGYDGRVTNVRVRLSGNQTPGSSFRIRFRVQLF